MGSCLTRPRQPSNPQGYQPAPWEKILVAVVSVGLLAVVSFLIIRNQPFADQNYAAFTHLLLSFAASSLGATIPGFLNVE